MSRTKDYLLIDDSNTEEIEGNYDPTGSCSTIYPVEEEYSEENKKRFYEIQQKTFLSFKDLVDFLKKNNDVGKK